MATLNVRRAKIRFEVSARKKIEKLRRPLGVVGADANNNVSFIADVVDYSPNQVNKLTPTRVRTSRIECV